MIKISKNLIKQCRYLKLSSHVIVFKGRQYFGQLPKPSRFSEQLGLQKQFERLQHRCEKQQKSASRMYELILWVFLCLVGGVAGSLFIMPSFRRKAGLFYHFLLLSAGNKNNCRNSLQKVLQYQQQFYQNRLFSDTVTIKIVSRCLELKELDQQRYGELVTKILYNNLQNRDNNSNMFSIYRQYLVSVYSQNGKNPDESEGMRKIITHLVKNADLQTVYLVVFMNNKVIRLSEDDKRECLKRVRDISSQLEQTEQNIKKWKENDANLLVRPYQFECQMRRKWVRYIQKNM